MYRINNEETRVLRENHLSIGEIRYAYPSCLWCVLTHPSNSGIVHHPFKMCERRSANGLTGQDLSKWCGLVCCSKFYRCPIRALITVRTGCCKTEFCRMCYKQDCPPLNGCNVEVLWGHIVSWRAWSRSGYSIAVLRPCQLCKCVCCWKRKLLFVLLSVLEAAIPLCYWSTIIANSYPWIIPMSLMCKSLLDMFHCVNKFPIQRQCFWYLVCEAAYMLVSHHAPRWWPVWQQLRGQSVM